MISDQVKCDVCGAIKGETNHWLVAVTIPPTPLTPGEESIAFAPIAATVEENIEGLIEHLCGHACAVKRFSQWLETLTQLPTPKGSAA